MWKVSFDKDTYKTVEVFNDKATVVTLTVKVDIPRDVIKTLPLKIYNWALDHCNPGVKINPYDGVMELKAKGKTVRKEEDGDKPLIAERLAECRAKMKIYQFMLAFVDNYNNYYMEILLGKNKRIYPTKDSSEPDKDSIWGADARFDKLWDREYRRCIKLQEELGRWD